MEVIPPDWLDLILAETARRGMKAAGDAIGPLGSDSMGIDAVCIYYIRTHMGLGDITPTEKAWTR